MTIKILLYVAIIIQFIAMYYAVRLVRATKYNMIWILFIIGFVVLAIERVLQLGACYGHPMPLAESVWFDIVVSLCVSVGMVMLDRLFVYIERLNRHRQLLDKRILTAVLRAEERSRTTFSKELHDGLGPLLSSAKISLSALSRTEMDKERKEIFDNTLYVVDEALRSLREISNNLSPHVLNNFGLIHGIKNFADRVGAMHNREIILSTRLVDERFDANIEVILYRVVCELVNNSLKHSACKRIIIEVNKVGKNIVIDYRDNGKGFNLAEVESVGMGLSNIKSRISSLGGKIRFESKPGNGMLAHIEVSTTGEIVQLAEDLYEQVYGKRYGRKKS